MSTCKRKDITLEEIPITKKLSRGARKRRNKRMKWEQIENETTCESNHILAEAPIDPNIVFNPLKV
jgi:hypothetical protein